MLVLGLIIKMWVSIVWIGIVPVSKALTNPFRITNPEMKLL